MSTAATARLALRWGCGAVCAAGLSGTAPARGDVVCYERQVTVEAQSGCVKVTLLPQRPDPAALQKLQAEHQAELARQKNDLAHEYDRQCKKHLEVVGQNWNTRVSEARETAKIETAAEWSGKLRQCDAAKRQVTDERDRLQSAAAKAAVRTGRAALAAFPEGAATERLAEFGMLTLSEASSLASPAAAAGPECSSPASSPPCSPWPPTSAWSHGCRIRRGPTTSWP